MQEQTVCRLCPFDNDKMYMYIRTYTHLQILIHVIPFFIKLDTITDLT